MSVKWSANDVGRPWGHAPHWAGRERSVHVGRCCCIFFLWDFDKPFSGGERHLRTELWSLVPGGREQKSMFSYGSIRWLPWLLSPASQPASFPCSPVWHPHPQASRARPCWPSLGPFCISSLCFHLNGGSLIHKAGSVLAITIPLHSHTGFVSSLFCDWNCWQLGCGDWGRWTSSSWSLVGFSQSQVFQSWEHISACLSLMK